MGSPPQPEHLHRDRVRELRRTFADRFAGDDSVREAVDSVLSDLERGWEDEQGMDGNSFDELNATLGPIVRRLLDVPPADAKAHADELVRRWQSLRGRLIWRP